MSIPVTGNQASAPLCYAPFTSFKIDTNKGVRPCSSWEDNYFGNIGKDDLSEILQSPGWQLLQQQMLRNEWPRGCMACKVREMYNGESLRNNFKKNASDFAESHLTGILEIEIDSNNNCNLACIHCSSDFSSTWSSYEEMLKRDGFTEMRTRHTPESFNNKGETLLASIERIELSSLRILRLKGGEPFLNREIKPVLQFLERSGCLPNLRVQFVTNATVIDKQFLEILSKCNSVHLEISIDGIGAVQEYIRYGNATISRLEAFIATFSTLPNVHFSPLVSVMVYNVFNLEDIERWWNKIHELYPGQTAGSLRFSHAVISPKYLSVNVLSEEVRNDLYNKYEKLDGEVYGNVLQALKMPWAGSYWHDKFVHYTSLMDKYRKMEIAQIVPALLPELVKKDVQSAVDIDELITEIDWMVERECATANLYLKRAFLKREKGDKPGALLDFNKAFELDISLYNSVPGHWLA